MATAMRRTTRTASPERWAKALERAMTNGVQVRQLAGSGQWIATSASRPGLAYETDGRSCQCEAAMLGGDPVCVHRAAYWQAVGALDPEPEPPAPAAGIVPDPDCRECFGEGYRRMQTGGGLNEWWSAPCRACRGKEVPAPLAA